ncbi:basic blue protein [Quercus suber]|uniref:Basic blue protein n=1 Tax=Quercus suber TaxID=58331 RepID=A0AAW0L908_QUESU|nr:basic blue protein-like [Quercus suber]POF05540.1 basic blue protein [Quercus suber]
MTSTIFGVSKNAIVAIGLLYILIICENAQGAEYVVGGKIGWDLDPSVFHWPEGKSFKAGDILIFNYSNPLFKVEQVNKTQFDNCYSDFNPIKTYDSGHDKVAIGKGTTYFICATPDYCGYGMRIVINAA